MATVGWLIGGSALVLLGNTLWFGDPVLRNPPFNYTHIDGSALAGTCPNTDTATLIRMSQTRLDELVSRFPDNHPDVIATRARLEELKSRQALQERCQDGDVIAALRLEAPH